MSTPLPKHSFGLRYIYLLLRVKFIRILVAFNKRLRLRQKKIHDGVVIKHITVPSRDERRHIKVHLYEPVEYDRTKPASVVINFHGSGFIIPSLGSDSEFCSLVAARTNALVFDADYRKAPEHPFPAAAQDAEDVAHYILANPNQYNPSNIFTSGFSAGGNLALVTASSLGPEHIKGVIAIYPAVDLTTTYPAPQKRMRSGITLTSSARKIFHDSYMLPEQSPSDLRISPILAPTQSFPKFVYLACGDADTLYEPCVKFVERLKEARNDDAIFVNAEYEGHGFDKLAKVGTESADMKDRVYTGALDMINRASHTGT